MTSKPKTVDMTVQCPSCRMTRKECFARRALIGFYCCAECETEPMGRWHGELT